MQTPKHKQKWDVSAVSTAVSVFRLVLLVLNVISPPLPPPGAELTGSLKVLMEMGGAAL